MHKLIPNLSRKIVKPFKWVPLVATHPLMTQLSKEKTEFMNEKDRSYG